MTKAAFDKIAAGLREAVDIARAPEWQPISTAPKHTPGPWVSSKFGFQVLTGDSWNVVCTLKGAAEWEDGRGKQRQEYEWQNQEANARLIAAAPDMYDALKHAREAFIVAGSMALSDADLVQMIDAALAKATPSANQERGV